MLLLHILEQAALFLPFTLGVYLTYQVLQKPDLTVDGSFVLGAAIYGLCRLGGLPLIPAMALGTTAGALAGLGTSLLQYRDRMSGLIAGILALFILQSLNLLIMGSPNLNLLAHPGLIQPAAGAVGLAIKIGIPSLLLLMGLGLMLGSQFGLRLYAFGENPHLLHRMGFSAELYRALGLAISNGLVALSGILTTQYQGYVDVGMGAGLVLIGIATVIIGQHLAAAMQIRSRYGILLCCGVGTTFYFAAMNGLLSIGVDPLYLKLSVGAGLAATLYFQPTAAFNQGAHA